MTRAPTAARRVVVFGNSGAGKSTLAQALVEREGLAHLDLDTIAWAPTAPGEPPQRAPEREARAAIDAFVAEHPGWVIEGCYADLLGIAAESADALVYLNPPLETCLAHARARPFEPHKYPSKEAQDANLPMLLDWIRAYESRTDEAFSAAAHRALYEGFPRAKAELEEPADVAGALAALG